jgi:hypothetical protein
MKNASEKMLQRCYLTAVKIRAGETKINSEIRKVKNGDQCEWV